MTLALLAHDDMLPPPAMRQKALSQWFTPHDVAKRLVVWCGDLRGLHVLEPSAGSGRIVEQVGAGARVSAFEIDPAWAGPLSRSEYDADVTVTCGDYLARDLVGRRYDVAIMNPPYEGGLDGRFVSKVMDESERVVALVRSAFVHGQDRHERVWSRVERGEWALIGIAYFVGRPSFGAAGSDSGSPLSDFVAIKLARSPGTWWRERGGTSVEWWR